MTDDDFGNVIDSLGDQHALEDGALVAVSGAHSQQLQTCRSVPLEVLCAEASFITSFLWPARRVYDTSGISISPHTPMAWRPYSNLIDGELDNRIPGKVTGWMRFARRGKRPLRAFFDLEGDFHDDIRGKVIRLRNPKPSDENALGGSTYMEGFSTRQVGTAGDITAGLPLGPWTEAIAQKLMRANELAWDENDIQGAERERRRQEWAKKFRAHIAAGDLFYPYVDYPYIEWYSENGRVVLELDPSQVEIVDGPIPSEKTPEELVEDERRRARALGGFIAGMVNELSEENRRQGGDGNVIGGVIG